MNLVFGLNSLFLGYCFSFIFPFVNGVSTGGRHRRNGPLSDANCLTYATGALTATPGDCVFTYLEAECLLVDNVPGTPTVLKEELFGGFDSSDPLFQGFQCYAQNNGGYKANLIGEGITGKWRCKHILDLATCEAFIANQDNLYARLNYQCNVPDVCATCDTANDYMLIDGVCVPAPQASRHCWYEGHPIKAYYFIETLMSGPCHIPKSKDLYCPGENLLDVNIVDCTETTAGTCYIGTASSSSSNVLRMNDDNESLCIITDAVQQAAICEGATAVTPLDIDDCPWPWPQ